MIKKKLTIVVFVFISLIAIFELTTNRKKKEAENSVYNPLGSLITLDAPGELIEILVSQDKVDFEPFEDVNDTYKPLTVKKADYPELFAQGVANLSFISAELLKEGSRVYVKLSNNQPDHGAFSSTHSLIIDPAEAVVK